MVADLLDFLHFFMVKMRIRTIIPYYQTYYFSGYFSEYEKMKDTLKSIALFYVYAGLGGLCVLLFALYFKPNYTL